MGNFSLTGNNVRGILWINNTKSTDVKIKNIEWMFDNYIMALEDQKKPASLDSNVLKNYSPVSYLPFMSTILAKVMMKVLSETQNQKTAFSQLIGSITLQRLHC